MVSFYSFYKTLSLKCENGNNTIGFLGLIQKNFGIPCFFKKLKDFAAKSKDDRFLAVFFQTKWQYFLICHAY